MRELTDRNEKEKWISLGVTESRRSDPKVKGSTERSRALPCLAVNIIVPLCTPFCNLLVYSFLMYNQVAFGRWA